VYLFSKLDIVNVPQKTPFIDFDCQLLSKWCGNLGIDLVGIDLNSTLLTQQSKSINGVV